MTAQLRFGTAGLRAPVGPGPDRMNVSTVTRATGGVAAWLQARHTGDAPVSVAVGYDSRYGSHAMARAAAETFAGAGFDVTLIAHPAPTPVIAWAVKHRGLDAGVQITASHNPKEDNGYKLFLAGGSQLVSPADREIEELIDQQPEAPDIPRSTTVSLDLGAVDGYVSAVAAPLSSGDGQVLAARRDLTVLYTALHGVGGSTLEEAFRRAGFHRPETVVPQRWPDPEFPTVGFPNPEEPGTCDLLLSQAGAAAPGDRPDLLIALDPDADRCMIGIPDADADSGFRMLRGDETGPLLAQRAVDLRSHGDGPASVVATTVVSSSLLGRIAAARGWDFRETMTGFKNLARAADDAPGELTYAYEEAIGTCPFPQIVADKDGFATALLAATWAAELKAVGSSLQDELDHLDKEFGPVRTAQVPVRCDSTSAAARLVADWAQSPPAALASGQPVTTAPLDGEDPTSGVRLTWTTGEGTSVPELACRVIARTSGTEPKAKFYLQVAGDPGTDVGDVESALESLAAAVRG
ncbi:phospho-sugar mutase [Corynebacterium sp.]|uniref:phospho-sugar mutase n=1 Tax=Corynebacterium sp. TaxID=1720 RepID=UPI0028AC4DE9|nr:phospho-sugar mutase [Corynebacterium sp.]